MLVLHLQTPAATCSTNTMSLPLELAPFISQFLPVETLEKLKKDDSLLISVLKIQLGYQPFKVIYTYSEETPFSRETTYYKVRHMRYDLEGAFSQEVLSSLGLLQNLEFRISPDAFASLLSKNDKADSYLFSQAKEIEFPSMSTTCPKFFKIDLSMFPKLRSLEVGILYEGVKVFPRSRTKLLNYLEIPSSRSTVDGVFDVSNWVHQDATVEIDRSQGFMEMTRACVDWKPCFDKSWCRSAELRHLSVMGDVKLSGISNLKILKFVRVAIQTLPNWLPNFSLERLIFWDCAIMGTGELESFPLVKELKFEFCRVESLQGHFPQLESFTLLDRYRLNGKCKKIGFKETIPIAKENLRKVKSFTLSTKSRRVDLSSFEGLKTLKLLGSDKLESLDGLHVDTLEWVSIERCPKLKVDFPCHVSVKISNEFL